MKTIGKLKKMSQNQQNTIKVGTFQLQTKSFWMGLVSILCLFMLFVIGVVSYFFYNISLKSMELNKQIIELNIKK